MPHAAVQIRPATGPSGSHDTLIPIGSTIAGSQAVTWPHESAERGGENYAASAARNRQHSGSFDLRIFRPEAFDAVWSEVVGARAAEARRALTPEAWRRLWLRGYAHLRKQDPSFYAPTAYGLERAIAVLAPLVRRIEVDFREADIRRSRHLLPSWSRCPPSAATMSRWLRTEAELSLAMTGARCLS